MDKEVSADNLKIYGFTGKEPYRDEDNNYVLDVVAAKVESDDQFETSLRFATEETLYAFVEALKALSYADFMNVDESGYFIELESESAPEEESNVVEFERPKYVN